MIGVDGWSTDDVVVVVEVVVRKGFATVDAAEFPENPVVVVEVAVSPRAGILCEELDE